MSRIWFLDGSYMDVPNNQVQYWLMDGEVEHIQPFDKDGKLMNLEDL